MQLPIETSQRSGGHGRWYDDACGTAFALELIGERWSLLIVRELMFGGRRFTDLRAGMPGISAKVLTERLAGLEGAGIVRRRGLPPPAATQVYELTEWGLAADEAMQALGRWAAKCSRHDPTLPLSAASLMMSLRTMVDPARAPDTALYGAIRIGREPFELRMERGELLIERGEGDGAQFTLTSPRAEPLAALVYLKVPPEALAGEGLAADGDSTALGAFLGLFELPEKLA